MSMGAQRVRVRNVWRFFGYFGNDSREMRHVRRGRIVGVEDELKVVYDEYLVLEIEFD